MERDVLAALREASGALNNVVPLLGHGPACESRPISTPSGVFTSGMPCSCPLARVVMHASALGRMVSPKRNGRKNGNGKKGGKR